MINISIWIAQVLLTLIPAVYSTELLPEKYLQPQDFNHHPFTDVGVPASIKKAFKLISPYALLAKKRPREGREFPLQNIVYYPTPHPSVLSKKQLETNEISKYDDPYVNIPKNYAFSYIVKDQHSGDDFSHSQAHNGKATRGQYRVKLPDGRTQIVSYTADHKGYRADVQYEEDSVLKPLPKHLFKPVQNIPQTSAKVLPNAYQTHIVPHKSLIKSSVTPPTHESDSSNYLLSTITAVPVQFVTESTPLKLIVQGVSSTVTPQYYHVHYSPKYVSTTPAPYLDEQYISSTSSPGYVQSYVSSTPIYPVGNAPTTPAPPAYEKAHYQNLHRISPTIYPQQPSQTVTSTPLYGYVGKAKAHQASDVVYRLVYPQK